MHFFKNNLRVLYIIVIMSDKSDILSDISKKFRCKICKKNYASNSSLWNHNNKFHMYVPEKSLPKLDKYLINLKSNLTNKLTCGIVINYSLGLIICTCIKINIVKINLIK